MQSGKDSMAELHPPDRNTRMKSTTKSKEVQMTLSHTTYRDCLVTVLLGTIFAVAAPASAQTEVRSDTDKWQFEITPYLFGAGMNGKTGIGSVTSNVDMSFSDILNNLDSGLMALFEARKGPWSFAAEGVYFKLKNEASKSWQGPLGSSATGSLEATMTEQIYGLTAAYRILDDRTKVDVLGSARNTQLDTELNLVTSGSLLPDGSRSISGAESWWDPVIGMRVLQPLAEAWTLAGYADIGGFGIGSDLTYQLLAGVNWQFSRSVSAKAGYRYLYQDYQNGAFIWEMKSSGFYLGAGFKF
jgi:opacity protein-like surface antigen